MIEVRDLYKSFGEEKVLEGVSLKVEKGENLVILGRSGTGKSVLLKIIVGLYRADRGEVRINGQEITGLDVEQLNEVRKRMGFLFQGAALFDSMTVAENVAFPLRRHTRLKPDEIKDRVMEKLRQVGLEGDADKMPAELSGGMRKRVGLARAIALDPRIIFYDEPTTGLDPITAREINDLIVRLKEELKVTSITVTHDLVSAQVIGDEIALLHEGRVADSGSFDHMRHSRNEFVRQFFAEGFLEE